MSKETRIYFRLRNPNPLFTGWLEYWLNEAEKKDSMKKFALAKALESIKKYPLVLYSGRDCAILDGFGSSICTMIDKQLQIYRETNPDQLPTEKEMGIKEKSIIFDVKEKFEAKRKQTNNTVLDFNKLNDTLEAFLNDPNVDLDHHEYNLPDGLCSQPEPTVNHLMPEKTYFPSGTYNILLLVDTQETVGKSKRILDSTLKALEKHNVNFEVRRLPVGDFLWICRSRSNKEYEIVLPYIVERKRMDDLASSIKDGRYHEQKFRLSDCGLSNKIYLIESRGNNSHLGLSILNLLQATTNCQIHNEFSVKFTDSNEDSMLYLSVVTNLLIKIFSGKNLIMSSRDELNILPADYYNDLNNKTDIQLMNFTEFAEKTGKMKNFTIRDMFTRQLVSLKSLSVEKATAITEIYPTPQNLIRAYDGCFDKKEAKNLLANIPCGKLKRPLGSIVSESIYKLYNSSSYE